MLSGEPDLTREPESDRVPCPSCGQMVLVNLDGTLRHHYPDGGTWTRGGPCPGSRTSYAVGSVAVRKLRDGVVVKVYHAPGVMGDDPVTDELVLTDPEWAELVRVTTMAERSRLRPLVASWRASAEALAARHPAWATHYLDCASELGRALAEREGSTDA
jgi:hypothetical protein